MAGNPGGFVPPTANGALDNIGSAQITSLIEEVDQNRDKDYYNQEEKDPDDNIQ